MEFEKIDVTQIVIALISLVGMIYGARKQSVVVGPGGTTDTTTGTRRKPRAGTPAPKPDETPQPDLRAVLRRRWPTILIVGCALIFFANLGYSVWRAANPDDPEVAITSPSDGGTGVYMQPVRGTSDHIPDDKTLWLVVFSYHSNLYYPASKPADMEVSGQWASTAYLGLPETAGESFDLLAVLVDREAKADFEAYAERCQAANDWPGYEALPADTEVYDRVMVTRQ